MAGAWKVGLFVVVFVGLLVGAYQIVGRSLFSSPGTIYFADFEDVGGIQRGASVLMAGVKVGTVQAIELRGPRLARLVLSIDPNVRIPAGSRAFLATSLIGFGDNPIQILPPEGEVAEVLAPGAVLAGRKGSALESLVPDLEQTIAELNATLAATRSLIEDEALRTQIEELLASTQKTIDQFGVVAGRVDRLIAANQGSIGAIVASVRGTLAEVEQGARLARELLADERWAKEAEQVLQTLNRTAAEAEKVMASVNQLVGDQVLQQNLKDTVANVKTVSDSGTAIAANAEEITRNGIVVSEQVAELARKANVLADQAGEVLGNLQGFFERVPRTSGLGPVEGEINLHRTSRPDRWRTDVGFVLPLRDENIHLGVFDAFEANRLNVQLGRPLAKGLDYRVGIYASKPGLGVDCRIAPKLMVRGDVFDINDPRLDLRARIDLGGGVLGWLGVDRTFDQNAWSLGVGIRK